MSARVVPDLFDPDLLALIEEKLASGRYASASEVIGAGLRALAEGGDTSERQRVERALRESEARFRHMADSAPALIWMTDAEGQLAFANMHYDHMFGRPAAEMLGSGWEKIVLPEDLERHYVAFFAAFRARLPFATET